MLFTCLTFGFWLIMTIYWIYKAIRDSQTGMKFEITSVIKLISSALILYMPLLFDGRISKKLFTDNTFVSIAGVAICAAGITFAIMGRAFLGRNWSGKVMIQKEHSLVQTGPYGITRHPQYTGSIIAYFGTAIVTGFVFSFAWSLILTLGLIWKARLEEKLLCREFPGEYPEYKKKVGMIVPKIW